jgi:nucleotide-binding universal stress UspA family protein
MTDRAPFDVLVATDGSRPAQAAVTMAVAFPWPPGARAHGVLARARPPRPGWPHSVLSAIQQSELRATLAARRALRRRWPDAEVAVVEGPPVDGILDEARRLEARAIVVGARGHGAVSRMVLGSVSLGVVRRATQPVLVVRGASRPPRRFALAVDGSEHAGRALELVAALAVPEGGAVTLVTVIEPVRPVSVGLLPAAVRATVGAELAALEAERRAAAQQALDAAAARLRESRWTAESQLRTGVPLAEILAATAGARADVLVLGARGTGGVERLLLGSVADGAVSRCPVPVLVVR